MPASRRIKRGSYVQSTGEAELRLTDVISIDEFKLEKVEKGKKSFGYYKIGETPILPIQLPVGVIKGNYEGPILCVVAGEHPCEYPGIDAAIRIFNEISPSQLRGTLIVIPVVNVVGFDRYTPYVCPLDGLNMAFQYPGDLKGTFSRVSAYYLERIVYQANYFVTLHGGEATELLNQYAICFKTGVEKVDRESVAMARVFDLEYVEERTEQGSAKLSLSLASGALFIDAPKRGIPAMVAEIGAGLGAYEEDDIAAHVKGVMNVLKHLKMMDGAPQIKYLRKKLFDDSYEIRVSRGGLFYPTVKLKDPITKGQQIGYVRNLRGETIESVVCPDDGFVHLMVPRHVVNTGDMVFYIGKNLRDMN